MRLNDSCVDGKEIGIQEKSAFFVLTREFSRFLELKETNRVTELERNHLERTETKKSITIMKTKKNMFLDQDFIGCFNHTRINGRYGIHNRAESAKSNTLNAASK